MYKKILLTGVNGQVGSALKSKLLNDKVVALSRHQLDLTNVDDIRRVIREIKPDLIVNPAAFTAVDKAENEPELAYAVNATAVQVIAEEAARLNAALIHFSTDYVYDGMKIDPYLEEDAVNPACVYGKTKLAGEDAIRQVGLPHLILRTSWVYGDYGSNFLKTILRLSSERDNLEVVVDQIGIPTSSKSIATGVVELLRKWQTQQESQTGVYHFTNSGSASWHVFACEIIQEYNRLRSERNWPALKVDVENIAAISTYDYPTLATRPMNSRLDNAKLKRVFGIELPAWQVGLREVMQTIDL